MKEKNHNYIYNLLVHAGQFLEAHIRKYEAQLFLGVKLGNQKKGKFYFFFFWK